MPWVLQTNCGCKLCWYLQYWPVYYVFFFCKKVKNGNISKTQLYIKKSFQWLLDRQMRKKTRKFQPSILKIVGGDSVWKIPENRHFLWIKSFLWIFRKKTAEKKIYLYSSVTPLVKVWETLLHKQKKILATRWVRLTILICCC